MPCYIMKDRKTLKNAYNKMGLELSFRKWLCRKTQRRRQRQRLSTEILYMCSRSWQRLILNQLLAVGSCRESWPAVTWQNLVKPGKTQLKACPGGLLPGFSWVSCQPIGQCTMHKLNCPHYQTLPRICFPDNVFKQGCITRWAWTTAKRRETLVKRLQTAKAKAAPSDQV